MGDFDNDRIEDDTTTTTTDEEKVEEPALTEDGGELQPAAQEDAQPAANPLLSSKSPLLRQSTEMEDSGEDHDSLE